MRRLMLLLALLGLCACVSGRQGDDDRDDDDTPFPADDDDSGTGDDDDSTPPPLDSFDDVLAALSILSDSEALDDLLRTVGTRERWPLRDGDRWLFVTRWEGETPGLVSDVNGWSPAPGTRAGDAHAWVLLDGAAFVTAPEGAKFKWTDGTSYVAGDEATAYGFDENGLFGYVAPPTEEAYRERFPPLRTDALPLPRALRFLLPVGFVPVSPSAASARTLLMHDGQNLFHPDAFSGGWQLDAALAAEPSLSDVVVIAVDNTADRLDVYGPVADKPFGDEQIYGGKAEDYEALLAEVVLPFARTRYGLVADGDSLMVAGSSMGGLISLWLAQRWELGCVGALSPTLRWGAIDPALSGADALANRWPQSPGHGATPIFLYSGGSEGLGCVDDDGDGVVEESQDQDNYCVTTQLRDVLAGLGYSFEADLFHWWEPGAQHTEPAWRAQLPRMLSSCAAAGWSQP